MLLRRRSKKSLVKSNAPIFFTSCDSSYYDYSDTRLWPWFDRPDAIAYIDLKRAENAITEEEAQNLRDFVLKGYIDIPGMIEPALVKAVNREIDEAIDERYQGYEYGSSQRIEGLHTRYPNVRKLWLHDGPMRYLSLLFEATPRPCQTLVFVFGSQQDAHQDTVHLTPFPSGYMCGIWIALEDVRPDSGELEIFVGSHRLPRLRLKDAGIPKVVVNRENVSPVSNEWDAFNSTIGEEWKRILREGKFEKLTYRPTRGTMLIWHENLMHGGSVRRDTSLSRRSIVSHVFADGALAYYDSTGNAGYMEPVEGLTKNGQSAKNGAWPDKTLRLN